MLLILKSHENITQHCGSWTRQTQGYVLAHHNDEGKAVRLPNFEVTNIHRCNQIMNVLETTGQYENYRWSDNKLVVV